MAILKTLKKNRKFYYKPGNFTAVSGLIYRMKQNAVGLANICILSTMVLVMVSGTVSLYAGMNDVLDGRYAGDVVVSVTPHDGERITGADRQLVGDTMKKVCREEEMCIRDSSTKAASHAKRVLFIKDGEVFHQIYKANMSDEEMFAKISDTLTVLQTGGGNRG